MTKYINTIKDLEAATYGRYGNDAIIKGAGAVASINSGFLHDGAMGLAGTAASPNLSSLYNMVYGQKVWSMINQEINPLSILPKRPYTSSGWRVMTKRPMGGSSAAFGLGTTAYSAGSALDAPNADEIGGVDENHALASTGLNAIAPEYTTLYMSPKTIAHQFDYSELAAEMAKIDDGVGDLRSLIREDMGKLHAEVQSVMAVMPLENYDTSGYDSIERNYTSLLKIVSSSQEMEAMVDASMLNNSASTTGGLETQLSQIYGNDSRDLVTNAYMRLLWIQ